MIQLQRLLTSCIVLLLTGCTAFSNTKKISEQVDEVDQQSDQLIKSLQKSERQHAVSHDKPWVSKKAIRATKERLPNVINVDITFATGSPMALNDFSKLINKLCGVPVRVTPDAEAKLMGGSDLSKGKGLAANQRNQDQHKITGIRWQGNLDGLLDVVAASLGLSWRYSNNEINLYYLDSRTFQIYAIPSETEMTSVVQSGIDAGISGDSGGSGGGGGKGAGQSSQTTSVSLKSSMVQDIRKSIESMLTPGIGRLCGSSATGTITVTDTPEVLNRIQHYITAENRSITKQVLLNVKVLTVALNDADQFDIRWDLVYQTGKLKALLKGANSTLAAGSATNSTISILGNSKFDGSALVLDALAKQGKVSCITSPSVTTLNLQPVPVQVATQTSYLSRVETTNTANVGSAVSMTPGTVTSGFNMNLLPFVMPDNQLLLQYSINLSELKELRPMTAAGGNIIQLPEIDNRIFSQKVKLRSGQTLVLSGFEQITNNAQRSGTGSVGNWLFGGGVNAKKKRSVIVIMITPVVME